MTSAEFLIDTSALVRIVRQPALSRWVKPLEEGLIARCPVTEIEFLYSAKNSEHREQMVERLDALFTWTPLDDRTLTRASSVQQEL
ncbi:PIN domain-containing protein, partial [Streptomyces sp. NPDC058459]|uniref:PIN domain-containing protein n=1 Tax=Streptomyces sp. NPDC058459 TaxID=3346508 RepID=UPI00365582FF